MRIETDRLIIRSIERGDEVKYAEMAKDGSLGEIGFDALSYIVKHKDFENVPKILETPYVKDPDDKKLSYPPYKYEIEMIKKGMFDPKLQDIILEAGKNA